MNNPQNFLFFLYDNMTNRKNDIIIIIFSWIQNCIPVSIRFIFRVGFYERRNYIISIISQFLPVIFLFLCTIVCRFYPNTKITKWSMISTDWRRHQTAHSIVHSARVIPPDGVTMTVIRWKSVKVWSQI